MNSSNLFHVSESGDISVFEPRPSPMEYGAIAGNVVFAISYKLLHNYLLPRNCPRVAFYPTQSSTKGDIEKFMGTSGADYVVAIERSWLETMKQTTIYCYELPAGSFTLLDECAGYYISYKAVKPISITRMEKTLKELSKRNVELRIAPNLWLLANEVKQSSLNFSLIRMANAAV